MTSVEKRSEFPIRVFISSACYALLDLRAELASHLRGLGYDPVLSDELGFPGADGVGEPWESCLTVLSDCPIAIVIIDGGYGEPLPWSHPTDFECKGKVSPTHAEFLYARQNEIITLVFIREDVLAHYQTYREWKKLIEAKKASADTPPILPAHIELETLVFVEQVKTARPIPWIIPFKDVTDIKASVQKQLLNELARHLQRRRQEVDLQGFLIKRMLDAFVQVSEEEIEKVINAPDQAIELIKRKSEQLEEASTKLVEANTQLDKALESAKSKETKQTKVLQKKLADAEAEVARAEKGRRDALTDAMFIGGQQGTTSWLANVSSPIRLHGDIFADSDFTLGGSNMGVCAGCGVMILSDDHCVSCGKRLCQGCKPSANIIRNVSPGACPACGFPKS